MRRVLCMLLVLAMVLSMVPAVFAEDTAADTMLYLNPGADWTSDGAWYAAYYWDGTGASGWANMADEDADGIHAGVIPAGYSNVIFVRMNPAYTEGTWDGKWNQTVDLTVPTDGTNCFVIENPWNESYSWNATGSWTTYGVEQEIETVELTIGSNAINGSDVAFTYTAPAAGILALTAGEAEGDVSITYTVNGGEARTLANGTGVELPLAEGDAVVITAVATGASVLEASWTAESAPAPTGTVLLSETVTPADEDEALFGVIYTTTAPEDGYVTIHFTMDTHVPEYRVVIADDFENAEWFNYLADNTINDKSFNVSAGDSIEVAVCTLNPETGEYEMGSVDFTLTFTAVSSEGGEDEGGDEPIVGGVLNLGSNVLSVAQGEAISGEYTYVAPVAGTLNITITDLICVSIAGEESWTADMGDVFNPEEGGLGLYVNEEPISGLTGSITVAPGDRITLVVTSARTYQMSGFGWNVTVKLELGNGTADEPYLISSLGDYSVDVPGNWSTYYIQYTTPVSGAITLTMNTQDGWVYSLTRLSDYSGTGTHYSDDNPVAASDSLEVMAGETIEIYVNTYNGGTPPAGTIEFTLSFEEYEVEAVYPLYSYDVPTTAEIPAGDTVKYMLYYFSGTNLEVTGEGAYVIMNGTTYEAVDGVVSVYISEYQQEVIIGNSGAEDAVFQVNSVYPLGSFNNPHVIQGEGTFTANVPGGEGSEGYCFNWTLGDDTKEGLLTVTINNTTAWQYSIGNLTTYAAGDLHTSADMPRVPSETVAYFAGNVMEILVNTYSDDYNYPAGTISFTVTFEECELPLGSQHNPYVISIYDELPVQVCVAAGSNVYAKLSGFGGYIATVTGENAYVIMNGVTYEAVDGVVSVPISSYSANVTIGNSGAEDAAFSVNYTIPLGTDENPEVITDNGTYTTPDFAETGYTNYYYSWTAPADGKLTVKMLNETNWRYSVWNKTDYSVVSHRYNQTTAKNEVTVDVVAGELYYIYTSTFDADTWGVLPGSISLEISFEDFVYQSEELQDLPFEIPAGGTQIITIVNTDGADCLFVTGENAYVVVDGVTHEAENGKVIVALHDPEVEVTIGNAGDTDATFLVSWGTGCRFFPERITENGSYTTPDFADTEYSHYYYEFVAPANGQITLELTNETNWSMNVVANLMSPMHWATYEESETSRVVLDVEEGVFYQIGVGTYDAASGLPLPGTVTLVFSFTEVEPLAITTQPVGQKVKAGSTAVFSVEATGTGLQYQWQYRTSSSGNWLKCTAAGNKTASMTVPATCAKSAYQYRCVITDAAGNTVTTKTVYLYVLGVKTQPADQNVTAGANATFTVVATGHLKTYQWQYRTSATGNWLKCSASGNDTATMTVPGTASRNGYEYRCKITDSAGNVVYTNVVKLTVTTNFSITQQPVGQKVKAGTNATFSVQANGSGLKYQWQYRTSASGNWLSCSAAGNKTATMKVPATCAKSGYQYRCKITDSSGTVKYTNVVYLYVLGIKTQPASQTVSAGTDAIFTVNATGHLKTYQWQYSTDGGVTWKNATANGNKTATLTVPGTSGRNGYLYRCQITDSVGNVIYSNAAQLTVN